MDLIDFARYVGALALVLGLLGFAALAAKRYGIAGLAGIGKLGGGARRLSVVETMMVGAKHKLILIKRDGVEHLVLIGPDGAIVVENAIDAPQLAQIHALHDSEAA